MSDYKYSELKQELISRIRDGRYAHGDMIESEAELQKHFNLSRNTVRQALSELENEGFVLRQRGKGTFVSSTNPNSSRKIALVLYSVPLMLNPVTANLILGIDEVLSAENYTLDILAGSRDLRGEKLSSLFQTYAGILIGAAAMDEELLQAFLTTDTPCVFLKNYRHDYKKRVWRIDFHAAGKMAAEHLVVRGITSVGVLYPGSDTGIAEEFLDGVRSVCLEHGVRLKAANILTAAENCPEDTKEKITACLSAADPPRGLICFTDTLAALAEECCSALNLAVPRDLAVTGCNNTDLARRCAVPLTSLEIPTRELGKRGTRSLLDWIKGKQADPPAVLTPELIVRNSSGV